jgi:threonine dehydratase
MQATPTVDPGSIAAVHAVISRYLRLTPALAMDGADFGLSPFPLTLKLESLQHSGSFKARGALANLHTRELPAAGVVAASGGNHGCAVAWAARSLGIAARIFIPSMASPAKIERIRSYGAELTLCGNEYADALDRSLRCAEETGALPVHAFDQVETMLGQGTIALELSRQAPDLDTMLVPVGGGGLIAGISTWFEGRVKVVGVEPEEAPTLSRALAAGEPVDAPVGSIAADSLAPRRIGALPFPVIQRRVHGVLLVTDAMIQSAQRALWEVARVVAEPGGATATAALLGGLYRPQPGERVGVLVSGGNTTAVSFPRAATVEPVHLPTAAVSAR